MKPQVIRPTSRAFRCIVTSSSDRAAGKPTGRKASDSACRVSSRPRVDAMRRLANISAEPVLIP